MINNFTNTKLITYIDRKMSLLVANLLITEKNGAKKMIILIQKNDRLLHTHTQRQNTGAL